MNVRYRFVLNLLRNGPENLRHFFNQSDSKQKIIATWSPAFPRASNSFLDATLNSYSLLVELYFVLERFSIECRTSKTKGITTANQRKEE